MKFLFLELIVVALVAIVVPMVMSAQFRNKIEAWRRTLSVAQTSTRPDQDAIPEIMRAFALCNGAIVDGPSSVMA